MSNSTKAIILALVLVVASSTVVFSGDVDAEDSSSVVDSETYVAQIGDVKYHTLQDAFNEANENSSETPITIELLGNFIGPGVKVDYGTNVILDFNGYTYTNNGGVGSTGTETNGFQLLKDSTVMFKDGTLTAVNSPACQILIQNYCDLTLDNMVINAANSTQYAVSNNYGSLTITNGTTINAADGYVAFDVYYYLSSDYADGIVVTLEDGTINGNIEYGTSTAAGAADFNGKAKLTITGGVVNGGINILNSGFANAENADITITGGTFSSDVSKYVSEGYQQVGSIVGPISTETPITPSNPDVVVDSETNTVIIPVDNDVSNATVSATVTVSDGSKVSMVYQGGLTAVGLAMSASQVTVENLPNVSTENLLTVYELNVTGGITQGSFDLTVTIDVVIPDGMVLSNAWVVYYGDNDVTESYRATVDGSSVTFTTNHTSTYAFYGEIVEEQTPLPPVWDDDDDYVPPVYVPEQDSGSDDTVTIVACAAAVVVAAIMAVFLIVERKH